LTKNGHRNSLLADEAPVAAEALGRIYERLGGNETLLAAKSHGNDPKPDFLLPERDLIVEIDEIQHFTSDRLMTFNWYPGDAEIGFEIESYRKLIEAWHPTADRYRAAKPAPDFPRPGGRRAQRAFFDAVRDLAAPFFGLRVCRVPAPECDAGIALERLITVLGERRSTQPS
jgi:hypothetical protein